MLLRKEVHMNPKFYSACTASLEALADLADVGSLHELILAPDGSEVEIGDTIADPEPTAEEKMLIEEMHGQVREFVLGLTPYLQCVVVRRFWLNHSPQKIAADLGRRRPAIYDALARVTRRGQKVLAPILAQ
jgi:DNA-directed RNA polymerase specialized sigma24 family protein